MADQVSALPEVAGVYWRKRATGDSLRRTGRLWTLTTAAHVVPFVLVAVVLVALQPWAAPVALISLAQAWVIPGLYARRGANVVNPSPRAQASAERTALGLLGDLVGHDARELSETGLALERGSLGVWLIAEAGALLIAPGGRRVYCFCIRVPDTALPSADRTAHLLLALRADEQGFATVANMAFSGATWRIRLRLESRVRPAMDAGTARARSSSTTYA